jgi:arsenate reductase-like glutaredoxin family protein
LLERGARLQERDLGKDRLSETELRELFAGRDPRQFLNPRNELFRRMKMKEKPPSPGETIRLMAKEPNLIRRPLVVRGSRMVAGFDQDALVDLTR